MSKHALRPPRPGPNAVTRHLLLKQLKTTARP